MILRWRLYRILSGRGVQDLLTNALALGTTTWLVWFVFWGRGGCLFIVEMFFLVLLHLVRRPEYCFFEICHQ
jgi:hypothetical protein